MHDRGDRQPPEPVPLRHGRPGAPGTEVRIADDGEVLIKSPTVFAGYYKDEEATREILGDDGWLRSGDIGELDADGFLSITDRKKDIIVTAGGKNVAPQNLENELKASKFVSQALVVGDKRPYCVALITLDEPEIVSGRTPAGSRASSRSRSCRSATRCASSWSRSSRRERGALALRADQEVHDPRRDFTMADDELTPTLKLKRRTCKEHFAAEIEGLYD